MIRYAIYFCPASASRLWQLGSAAIGYDAATGEDVPFPTYPLYNDPQASSWTQEPRRYGFHATLKAPFELAQGQSEAGLLEAARAFASRKAFEMPELLVRGLGHFIALVPANRSEALETIVADCVSAFEPFRAPLSDADMARRLKSPLTPRQIGYLKQYGYPYVFEDFRFHMTLSGAINEPVRRRMLSALGEIFAGIEQPVLFDGIALCRQENREGRFRVLERFGLAKTSD